MWFSFTASASSHTLYTSGVAAGQVRVFTASTCSTGFVQVQCQASAGNNQNVGNVALTGLLSGQRYYVAVSGYGSNDAGGAFTLGLAPLLATRPQVEAAALTVFPNPTATGSFTLRLLGYAGRPGTVTLHNALGQAVRTLPLAASGEPRIGTQGLSRGLYTVRLQIGTEVLLRKVMVD